MVEFRFDMGYNQVICYSTVYLEMNDEFGPFV